MPKIYYTPFDNALNAYTDRMKSILSVYGDVNRIDKKSILKKIIKFDFRDVIVVNWLENIIVDKRGNLSLVGLLKIFSIFICFRLLFSKFIYVRHNHYPHSCNAINSKKAKKILDLLERFAHVTVVHSPVEVTDSRKYVPHPLYNVRPAEKKKTNSNRFVIFGSISRYKKIESVICNFPENLSLLIMGKCSDADYLDELLALIKHKKNIDIISDYVTDEKAREIINDSAGLLITHNDDDMIVSGSFFYAMSIGSKVFVLKTPFFEWAQSKLSNHYVEIIHNFNDLFNSKQPTCCEDVETFFKDPQEVFCDEAVINALEKVIY